MQKSKKQYIKKILIGLAATLVVLISLSLFAVLWQGSTKDIEAVANNFTPPDEWTQTHYEVVPPKFICLMGNCPEVIKSWENREPVVYQEVKELLGDAAEGALAEERCKTTEPTKQYCEFSGKKGGYQYRLAYRNEDNSSQITLRVREKGYVNDYE